MGGDTLSRMLMLQSSDAKTAPTLVSVGCQPSNSWCIVYHICTLTLGNDDGMSTLHLHFADRKKLSTTVLSAFTLSTDAKNANSLNS